MHTFCIKLITILIPLTLASYSQSSKLPSSITDNNPSHHQHHVSPSAFHDPSSSSSSSSSSSASTSASASSSISSISSASPSHLIIPSDSLSDAVETSDFNSEPDFNQNNDNNNNNDNNDNDNDNSRVNDRFHLFSKEESHHNSQSVPVSLITNYNNNHNHHHQQQHNQLTRSSSILLPKIYPSPAISDQFSSSSSSSISFPSHSINLDEGKSLDYATTLIKEALEGPMINDSNGDSSDYVDPGSSSTDFERTNFEGANGQIGSGGERRGNSGTSTDIDRTDSFRGETDDNNNNGESGGSTLNGDADANAVQPSEDELFYEVQKLIQYIRESAAPDDKGSSPKSRNNRNRLTLQMDYLQNLLDEYRQKQGSINLRHWVRGVSPPRLSVTSPIAVLRDALMEEIKRKKIQETQAKIALNEKILKEVG